MEKIKIIIVDDHKLFRDGLKLNLLDYSDKIEVIGEAGSGGELFTLLQKDVPHILLLDYQLHDTTGVEIISRLKESVRLQQIKTIILSAHTSERYGVQCYEFVIAALEAGANGYLGKDSTSNQIYSALIEVSCNGCFVLGETFNLKEVSKFLLKDRHKLISFLTMKSNHCLTKREIEVIEYLANGLLVKEIAFKMGISVDSVNSHKENIRDKILRNYGTNLHNTVEMVVWGIRNKLITI
jgi:DNA-binding NarL/FixJ family response regulator